MTDKKLSWKGAEEACPVCSITVRLTATGRFSMHGPRENRCATSGLLSPTVIEAGRGEAGGIPQRLDVRTFSYEMRTIYTLAKPYRVVTADGRAMYCAAVVVTQGTGGRRHARGIGRLGMDSEPREYRLTPDWEQEILKQTGAVR